MRIYITGPSWSGKSTLAERLGAHFRIPVIHLDELLYEEGFVENEDYWALQVEVIRKNEWIIEGASVSILKIMQHRIDRVIILNYPPIGNVIRVLFRFFEWLLWKRRVGWNTEKNSNRLWWRFLVKTTNWRTRQLPRIRINIMECSLQDKLIEIDSIKNAFEQSIANLRDIT